MATMNNTKLGGRISEIDINIFLLEKFNQIANGNVVFKMGLDNVMLNWYKPIASNTARFINEGYFYNYETYQNVKYDFVPTELNIVDMGMSSALDHLSGSVKVIAEFGVEIDDPVKSELQRIVLENIRDTLRQGFFVTKIKQRPYTNDGVVTEREFKFNTNTGTLKLPDTLNTINGKKYAFIELDIDIEFTDMEYIGNEYMFEVAIKLPNGEYSEYERVYPISSDLSMTASTKEKQELLQIIEKTLEASNESEYNDTDLRYEKYLFYNTDINSIDLEPYGVDGIIKKIPFTFEETTITEYNNAVNKLDIQFQETRVWVTSLSNPGGTIVETYVDPSIVNPSSFKTFLDTYHPATLFDYQDVVVGKSGEEGLVVAYGKVNATLPNADGIISTIKNDYEDIETNLWLYTNGLVLKCVQEGVGTTYWKLIPASDTYINYYKVIGDITSEEEQKAWEAHSIWESKAFGFTMDLVYRKPYAHENVGIIQHLFNDTIKKKWGYNVYKIRVSHYNLNTDGEWTLDDILFERYFVLNGNEIVISLGSSILLPCAFVVSDVR